MNDIDIFENKTVAYYTLGCKLNFAETSTISRELSCLGIRKAKTGEKADYCLVNTCSVTELADKKCRRMIRSIKKQHPDAFMIVTGCYAQLNPAEIFRIEGVDLVLGVEEKGEISKILQNIARGGKTGIITSPQKEARRFVPSCSTDDRTRRFLKVQDGCDYCCTYCTIPFARGRSRNGKIRDLAEQAENAVRNGGREIVLTGVNIGDFGKSTGEKFIDLIRELDRTTGIDRFRISSIEPELLTDEIIAFVAESKHFMPHFHIPLQSGSDDVLRLMNRRYDTALFRNRVETVKRLMPDAFIGVDVITGMRGETPEYFAAGKRFIEELTVSQLHVFNYSERPGTKALKIHPQVSHRERGERSRQLLNLSDDKLHDFYESHTGKRAKVLFEHARKGNKMYGFTENYIKTEIQYDAALCNVIKDVKLTGWNEDKTALTAEIIL
ncbi:MAG: tRNA (N(6)-L-threonylcarbamoyladenosine(37)-C(2))-methylthiotransferase MtaB [Tannerella sp.]|jgi:threonylcarbamoyladenosine tRNA methylthiotransferase MtaB|nr:tRNA (N(6)-L-threonylcarbamoyladenosine(37)-C(2))-methylthiotransferase MtaB [Tannerella sp.]